MLTYRTLRAVFSRYEDVGKHQNTRDHLALTMGNWDLMHGECVSHTGYLAHGNSEGEARGRSRYKYITNTVVRNMEERNVGTIRSNKV